METGTVNLYNAELSTTVYGQILQKIVRKDGFAANIIENYNNEILVKMKEAIQNTKFETRHGIVTFSNITFGLPKIESGGVDMDMIPRISREKMNPYTSEIRMDMTFQQKPKYYTDGKPVYVDYKEPETQSQVLVGSIPVMLGSDICHLHNKSVAERMKMGECFNDILGYFIIQSERVIQNQEMLRLSTFMLYQEKNAAISGSADTVVGKITFPTNLGTIQNKIIINGKTNSLIVYLAHLDKKAIKPFPPLFAVFKVFGLDPEEATELIFSFMKPEHHEAAYYKLASSRAEYGTLMEGSDDYEVLLSKLLSRMQDIDKKATIDKVAPSIKDDLFLMNMTEESKVQHLAMYTARILEYMIGERELDDRDSYANKKIETAGTKLSQLFKAIWAEVVKEVNMKSEDAKTLREITTALKPSEVKKAFEAAFGPNAWGTKKMRKKENVTEALKRDTPMAVYSLIGKINVKANRRISNPKVRMPHGSQLGYICPFETPEGISCGLVRNLAASCYISLERDPVVIYNFINNDKSLKKHIFDRRLPGTVPILLNGIIQWWCYPEKAIPILKSYKSRGLIYKDSCLFFNRRDNCIEISCDGGRPMRPLFIVDENCELVIDKKRLWNADIDKLVEEGCIEYIDAREQEWIYLAEDPTYVHRRKALMDRIKTIRNEEERKIEMEKLSEFVPFTHSEIDPTAMFGVSGTVVPQANRQAGPRTSYQCVEVNTLVTMSDGTQKAIKDLKDGDMVVTVNPVTKEIESSAIGNHFIVDSKVKDGKVYKISTLSGRELIATDDHQFLTSSGWKELGKMMPGVDNVSVYPVTKTFSTDVEKFLVMDEKILREKLVEHNVKPNIIDKHVKDLVNVGMLPLYSDFEKIDSLARIYGHTITDGSVNIYNGIPRLNAGMELPIDIEAFENDVNRLGFPKYVPSVKHHESNNTSQSTSRTGAICSLLIALGTTIAPKQENACNPIPDFIMKGSKNTKREFLSAYQGGDGSRIRWNKNGIHYNYVMASTMQHKKEEHIDSLFSQMNQIKTLIEEFDIRVALTKSKSNKSELYRCELKFSDEIEEHIKYMDTIGFTYCRTKQMTSFQVTEYLKYKVISNQKLYELKQQVLEMYNKGYKKCEIKRLLNLKDTVVDNFVRRPNSIPKSQFDFMKIDEWCTKRSFLAENVLFEGISEITEVEHCMVSDFTTVSDNHSFVANGFVTHNCGMNRQALSQYHSNEAQRFDASYKMLLFPSKSLFQTDMQDTTGLNLMPNGLTAQIAIMAHPDNPEDGIILKEEAGKYGNKFDNCKKFTFVCKISTRTGEYVERFARPASKPYEPDGKYAAINENGIPKLDAYIKPYDCVIGRVREYSKSSTTAFAGRIEECCEFAGIGEEGYVDRVLITKNISSKEDIMKVKLRQYRKYIPGDKAALRYSQKGTVAVVIPARHLPRVASGPLKGMVPDVIINPHSQPSRMTMNMMLEILVSKAAAISGRFVNATTFRDFQDELRFAQDTLEAYGLDRYGKEEFVHPNGVKMASRIYFGPAQYQALRHQVTDKIQKRAHGSVKPSTRQPVAGRSNEGGLKVGEMERDALVSHGASALLRERLCDVSDPYDLPICKCGVIAITNHEEGISKCPLCGPNAKIGVIRIPYVIKLLLFYLNGAGIQMKFKVTETSSKNGRPEEKFLV